MRFGDIAIRWTLFADFLNYSFFCHLNTLSFNKMFFGLKQNIFKFDAFQNGQLVIDSGDLVGCICYDLKQFKASLFCWRCNLKTYKINYTLFSGLGFTLALAAGLFLNLERPYCLKISPPKQIIDREKLLGFARAVIF
jgi:hypothetical protein